MPLHDLYLALLARLESGDVVARNHADRIKLAFGQELERQVIELEKREKATGVRCGAPVVSTIVEPDNLRRVSCSSDNTVLRVRMTPGKVRPTEPDTTGKQLKIFE